MKILHTTKALWSGGIETMVCNLANHMCDAEDVSVCTIFEASKHDISERLSPKVTFFDLGYNGKGKPIKEIFKFFNKIRKEKYDIVNVHGFFYFYMFSIFLLHNKIKFVYTLHSDASHEGTEWDIKLFKIKRFFFKKGWMKAVCISHYAQKSFEEMYGCHCTLIHNGIPRSDKSKFDPEKISAFKVTSDSRVFIHPARITKAKNQLALCKAFHRLIMDGYDVVLLIAGANHDRAIFDAISPYFSNRIRYLGVRNDIVELLSSADGMCLPSVFEGFGLVIVESFSVSCIPICTPIGGITDLVTDKYNGILANSTSEEDYYNAMVSFLSMDFPEVAKMKKNSLLSFERFSIDLTVSRYISLYRTLLEG